jgi:hypothetical protein
MTLQTGEEIMEDFGRARILGLRLLHKPNLLFLYARYYGLNQESDHEG